MKCPNCKGKAIIDPIYGVTECLKCRESTIKPRRNCEFTADSIKESRREYYNDIVQPYRGNTLSKEYLEAHGIKGISPTKEELKNAKYVWKSTPGWENRHKSR